MVTSELRLEKWKQKLLDLGKKNRLLNYRETKRSNLKILEPDIDRIFQTLNSNQTLEFVLQEPEVDQISLFESEDNNNKYTKKIKLKPNQLLTDRSDSELIKTLAQIRNKAKTAIEEQSINILYVAFGFLSWKEVNNSNVEFKSPLVLVPVSLILESIWENYKLNMIDDDVLVNPTLLFKLDRDFGITLPSYDDYEEVELSSYLEGVHETVVSHGWKVIMEAHLSLFSFHKINMYQDLDKYSNKVLEHPLIKAFAGDRSELKEFPDELNNFDHDAKIRPIDTYQVVDADSSQQDAVVAAKKGISFVLQGPPGTGKSQTITNIIAECLADGKSVLFVSEKMAALEVVYKRLKEATLTDFCLQLHSRKANKREVLTELSRTLKISRVQTRDQALAVLDQLLEHRNQLNDYAKSLHIPCEPLGRSIYEIHGRLQQFQNAPDLVFNVNKVGNVTVFDINMYSRLLSDFARTASKLGSDYESNPWKGCNAKALTLELQHNLQTNFRKLSNTLVDLYQDASKYCCRLKLSEYNTLTEIATLIHILKVSARSTKPPVSWFTNEDITPLAEQASTYLELSNEYGKLKEKLLTLYHNDFLSLPATDIAYQIKTNTETALEQLSNENYPNGETVISHSESLCNDLNAISRFLEQVDIISKRLSDILGIDRPGKLVEVYDIIGLVSLILSEPHPADAWFDSHQLVAVKKAFNDAKDMHEQVTTQEQQLIEIFDREILSLDYTSMRTRFRAEYTSLLKYFKSSYYKDKKTIQALKRTPSNKLKDEQIVLILKQVKNIAEKKAWLSENKVNLSLLLGAWYNGEHTDWEKLDAALGNFMKIIEWFTHKEMPSSIRGLLINPAISLSDIKKTYDDLVNLMAGFSLRTIEKTLNLQIPVEKIAFGEMQQMASAAHKFVETALVPYYQATARYKGDTKPSYINVLSDLNKLMRLLTIEGEITEKSEQLKELYGYYFKGIDTNWNAILISLAWSNEFMEVIRQYHLPMAFVELVCLDDGSIAESADGANKIEYLYNSIKQNYDYLVSLFDEDTYDFAIYNIIKLHNWLDKCIGDFSALEEWIDFSASREKCIEAGLGDFVEKVIEACIPSNAIVGAFFKRFYRLWLDIMYQRFPAILSFRRRNHEELINDFRQLDENQLNIARARIRERLCQKLPDLNRFTTGKDELGILQRELGKRRKIMPLRKLFQNIPNLLLTLKPCFMMSPLTVSIFLDPECYKFDVVIFDEASQIYTEDAIGAIFRGSQVIIAGDSEQLPPTNFFTTSTGEIEFDTSDEDEIDSGSYESVLDEAKSILPEETLLWHYRSRHEHLIAFSNAKIYKNLVTFPSYVDRIPDHGVEYIYIKNGVYDRSGKRDNKIEAQKVAELVFGHFEKFPNRSLGVVTFSEAQQQAVEVAVRSLRIQNPEYEQFFDESNEEGFFIKNIENVQGDERDTIIFSIGYAKDQNGVLHMNFGPLSKSGGYRRLNVAITRAKYNVKLVGSIRPTDIDLDRTGAEGVKMLRSYIEFAIKGPDILLNEIVEPEKVYTESPFEEEIYKLLVDKGYKVVTQVGCSGYRIDMAIKHPLDSGRYVLGIECDGATYHSARTARERDRLRQSVLEDRGWRIYRIWSTDWIKDPQTETQRLLDFIEDSLNACIDNDPLDLFEQHVSKGKVMSLENICSVVDKTETTLNNKIDGYNFKEYKEADIDSIERTKIDSDSSYLTKVIRHILEVEGPIHYDLLCKRLVPLFGMQKATITVKRWVTHIFDNHLKKEVEESNGFYKIKGTTAGVRVPAYPDEARPIEYICIEEIADAMLAILCNSYGISSDDLIVETARIFGYNRTGGKIKDAMARGVKYLLERGIVEENAGKIIASYSKTNK